jgi:HK97 family phage portal protein
LSQEEFLARFYGQGANIGGILEHPGPVSDKARKNLVDSFNKTYTGNGNAWKVLLLEEGIKYNKTIMPLVDAQFLEQRVYGIQDMARWLNMPPHKLKDLSKATYSNIEQEQSSYYQDTIRPHLERDESSMDMQLLTGDDEENAYIEYDFNAILRADIKTRYETYDIARRNGVINADQWREAENMNPIGEDHGKKYWMPANMLDAEKITEEPPPPSPVVAKSIDGAVKGDKMPIDKSLTGD